MKYANTIEVIVPTYNRPDCIIAMFDSILLQTVKPVKISIIDAGSISADYGMHQKLFDSQKIEFKILKSKPGLTYQRNIGMKDAVSDIILFLDDDVILDHKYIEAILTVFNSSDKVGGVTGKIANTVIKPSRLPNLFKRLFFLNRLRDGKLLPSGFPTAINYQSQPLSNVDFLSGCNMAYRNEVIKTFKFDEMLSRYGYMEDIDYSYRVSKAFQLVYTPDAILEHNAAPQGRLNDFDRFRMLVHHHHYLFGKNCTLSFKNKTAHAISILGIVLQALMLQRSINGFKGALHAVFELIRGKKVLPL